MKENAGFYARKCLAVSSTFCEWLNEIYQLVFAKVEQL